MEMVAPVGPVYQAGTLSGNPVAMTAGITQLQILLNHPEYYRQLDEKGEKLYGGMEKIVRQYELPCTVNHISSLGCLFFTETKVTNYAVAKSADTKLFADYFRFMIEHGIHLAPSQFEAMFLSVAHTDEIIDTTLNIFEDWAKSEKEKETEEL